MSDASFSEVLGSLRPDNDQSWSASISENWMQGRTTYGGLSAALCLKAIENTYPDLPPLRSAQISFIGPTGGDVSLNCKIMRQGRSVAYISADIVGEKGLATHAIFCFGESRKSRLNCDFTALPAVPSAADSKNFFDTGFGPAFANNFDCLLAQGGFPLSGSKEHEHFIWVRHKDPKAIHMPALLGIADMPPPAVLPMFEEFAPVSSMTWMLNFLSEDINTEDGWWLMRSAAENVRDGYSSQDMQIWNSNRELIVSARQNVAVYY